MLFEIITKKEFIDYTENTNSGNFLQTAEMSVLKTMRGQESLFLGIKDSKDKIVYATLMTRCRVKLGYIYNISAFEMTNLGENLYFFLEHLQKFIKKNKGICLTIEPNMAYRTFDGSGYQLSKEVTSLFDVFYEKNFLLVKNQSGISQQGNPRWIYIKNLSNMSQKDLVASYEKTAIYHLNKAKKFGITVRQLNYDELSVFKKITQETSERKNFKDKSLDYYQQVYKIYGKKAKFLVAELNSSTYLTHLLASKESLEQKVEEINKFLSKQPDSRKKNNQKKELLAQINTYRHRIDKAVEIKKNHPQEIIPLACALFMICRHEVVYLFSGTVEEFKNMYAPFLIQDTMLSYTVKKKIPLYNFYGIKGDFSGQDGILKFKESFGGMAVELTGEFIYVTPSFKSRIYLLIKKLQKN